MSWNRQPLWSASVSITKSYVDRLADEYRWLMCIEKLSQHGQCTNPIILDNKMWFQSPPAWHRKTPLTSVAHSCNLSCWPLLVVTGLGWGWGQRADMLKPFWPQNNHTKLQARSNAHLVNLIQMWSIPLKTALNIQNRKALQVLNKAQPFGTTKWKFDSKHPLRVAKNTSAPMRVKQICQIISKRFAHHLCVLYRNVHSPSDIGRCWMLIEYNWQHAR